MPRKLSGKPSRKLKTYQTSLGFYDQAVAAPSMKAALDAWGAKSNLFHQGIAKETDDADIVAATMAAPGVVLRRPVGSDGAFTEHAELPTDLAEDGDKPSSRSKPKKRPAKTTTKSSRKIDDQEARRAAASFAKEEQRRESARRKEEAARARERARREKAIAAAQAALDKARRDRQVRVDEIEAERAALDERAGVEEASWNKQRIKLEEAVRRARE